MNPEVIVDSAAVLRDVSAYKRRFVGSVEYAPNAVLTDGRELDMNSELNVRIDGEHFAEPCAPIARRALWGTDVYTDDSDLVAVLRHAGHSFTPQNDASVQILLLPPLKQYAGSHRNGLGSRNWTTRHDGISYMVLSAKKMPRGWARAPRTAQPDRLRTLAELRKPYHSGLV